MKASMRTTGLIALGLALLGSACGVVYAEYETRELFARIQKMRADRDRLEQEWKNLRIDQSTWGAYGRVAPKAQEQGMHVPPPEEVVVLRF